MTATEAFGCEGAAAHHTMTVHRLQGISRTAGLKSAGYRHAQHQGLEGRYQPSIGVDQTHHKDSSRVHVGEDWSGFLNRRARFQAVRRSASTAAYPFPAMERRATNTMETG